MIFRFLDGLIGWMLLLFFEIDRIERLLFWEDVEFSLGFVMGYFNGGIL